MISNTRAAAPSTYWATRLMTASAQPIQVFRVVGQWVVFIAQTFWLLPLTVRKYRRQTLLQMNNLAWGRGSIIVDGGVISVLLLLGIAVGASLAVEALATLNQIGFGALSGHHLRGGVCSRDRAASGRYRVRRTDGVPDDC